MKHVAASRAEGIRIPIWASLACTAPSLRAMPRNPIAKDFGEARNRKSRRSTPRSAPDIANAILIAVEGSKRGAQNGLKRQPFADKPVEGWQR